MTEWAFKRFWKSAQVVEEGDAFAITLDGRPVRTPAKAPLHLPTRAMADAVAAEWDAAPEVIDPRIMPATRAANAAIDKVIPQFDEVAGLISDYGGTDLLCYRAAAPQRLADRQAEAWDPLLDWAAEALGARLVAVPGVMHIPQDAAALQRLDGQVRAFDPFRLTAFSDLVGLSGSLVLGFAVTARVRIPDDVWTISRIDEDWQIEQWGEDEEAAESAENKRAAFLRAAEFFQLAER
ncbi:ATP12 family chaperone protein [Roseisalinus antarcticus]|uniref:ATP12 chaperone protein n=1 Tax=Roseisalinus antarcticus TaxID=254357 RepID=A0A1Y5TMW0_9RHOB|nr:ATP12 family protein [Roseisalinus antarcticus]SLN67835.1 ATP12 chaperone protein [Roseisalinus antarcticus]